MNQFSQEFRDGLLKEVEETGNIAAVARKHGVSPKTVGSWVRNHKNKDKIDERLELKKLKQELADKDLEINILKDLLKKTNQAWLKS